jgi:hypothetical protein
MTARIYVVELFDAAQGEHDDPRETVRFRSLPEAVAFAASPMFVHHWRRLGALGDDGESRGLTDEDADLMPALVEEWAT